MKFSQMKYERPNKDEISAKLTELSRRLREASSYTEAKGIFLEYEKVHNNVDTLYNLVLIRHSIDTRDEFYSDEMNFWNDFVPEVEEFEQQWKLAMFDSKFRPDFEKEYGELMFINTEIRLKTFSPEIIPLMQQENDEIKKYDKLIASAEVPFEGKTYTLSQMSPFQNDADDERRLAAWKAVGEWFKKNQPALDEHYDKLTKLRDEMGRKLGYDGYTELGYYRMERNCYTKEDVNKFREAVLKYIVPIADQTYREQAKRLGKEYPMSYADNALGFRSGNPKPFGTPDEILNHGLKFYSELSPETGEFFTYMMENELLDVLSTEGKEGGGYCTSLIDYKCPFIFANFNGTQHDVEVVTHEAGHAFEAWTNRNRVPSEYQWPTLEACEVHSMSMEFFAWPWAEGFFGKDTNKFYYSHLAGALQFIPYGTLVDHFQHEVYARPEMTPQERHDTWKKLQKMYMPWVRLDGEIPFYSEGEAWQRQSHIYGVPFYYIDYCLAQTVALQFWALSQKDYKAAWQKYMDYTAMGGSDTFTDMLEKSELDTPFDENCLRTVAETAKAWLDNFDMSKIEG